MRQGRPGVRGKLVQAEARLSQTGWPADEWLPVAPGGEHALALAIGHVLLREGLARNAEAAPAGVLDVFQSLDLDQACVRAGLERARVERVARELGQSSAPLVVAGASIVRTNSFDAVVAGNVLNVLLGAVGRPGGVMPPVALPEFEASRSSYTDLEQRLARASVVLFDGADPVFTRPDLRERLASAPIVISFAPVINDSAAYADLVLPDHSSLESSTVAAPPVSEGFSLVGAPAFVRPLHDTRSTEEVLVELASRLERPIEGLSSAAAFDSVFGSREPETEWESSAEFARYCERRGGWWSEGRAEAGEIALRTIAGLPEQDEGDDQYPYRFQAYPSLQFGEGAGAVLPWLQQMPDPTSSAMWNLPIEIDPRTAAEFELRNGDSVRAVSRQGSIDAPVYVNPAAPPGVVSMAIGQGHAHNGRYASGRGANPLEIATHLREPTTGVPAFGSAMVRLEKISGGRGLAQFATSDRKISQSRP